ncbi:hypothetical protein [Gordonia sp. DT101]|uniref:hypothetical protein n=1 Tax=Gordonia sp. DT101 TaxID=3416545 RepID=UPI003CF29644
MRLGVEIIPDSNEHARATDALWSVSTRARSITEQAWADPDETPDAVVDVVLSAAMRIYRNPDRFLSNQAGSFTGTLAASDFADGDLFLPGERVVLERHKATGPLTTMTTTRNDPNAPNGPWDPRSYVPDTISGGLGDPFHIGTEV